MALRVLHIGKFFPPERGGMEIFLAHLIDAQRAQGIDATALVHGTPRGDDPPWLRRVPVQFELIYAPIALGFRAAIARAIAHWRPDVLHLHMPNNSVLWVLTLPQARALPWVVHWHSDVVLSNIKWSVAFGYALYRPFEQAVLDGAERIIATSTPYLEASEPLKPWRSKCAVVPLGLDTRDLPAAGAARGPAAWRPDTRLRLLSIGRLTYYKGFETLIKAVQALSGVELLIAGDGELRGALQTLIRNTTRAHAAAQPAVRLLGEIDEADKHALLAGCDVFCLASRERTEAFGVVLLEAMAHARPCIVTDLPGSGMPWVVAQARCGLHVPIEDIDGWKSAITQLHDAPLRERLGAAGKKALPRFDIDAAAAGIQAQYRTIVPGAAPAPNRGVLVAIMTKNDAATVGSLVQRVRHAGFDQVLVVDNRSTDGSGEQAERARATVLRPLIAMTRWSAIQTSLRYARARGHTGVVTLEGDGRHDPAAIAALLNAAGDADLVIGASGRPAGRRRLAMRWLRGIAGFDLRDPTSGFRHYGARALDVLASREATLLDDPDLGVLLLARSAGLRISEVALPERQQGVQPAPPFRSWAGFARYLAESTLLCLARRERKRRRAAAVGR